MSEYVESSYPAALNFRRPAFVRLVQIELRKSIDTRAGFWLLAGTAILTLVGAIARAMTGDAADHALRPVLEMSLQPTNVLLPIVGILLVTSEWSQRTALTTFSQVPNRMRVLGAKCAAGTALGLGFFAFAVVVAASTVAIFGADAPDQWVFGAELWLQYTLFVILGMFMGLALGAMLLASAPAIVVYFAAPTVIVILAGIKSLESALSWIDPSAMAMPLTVSPLSSEDAGHLLTSVTAWIVIPLAIGCWRISRAEID